MRQYFRLGLAQRFLLLFILGGIVPVLLVGIFLIRDVHIRLESRLDSLLETGQQLALSIIQSDLEQLTLTAQQAVAFSIDEHDAVYLKTHNKAALDKALTTLIKNKHLEFAVVTDETDRVIASQGVSPDNLRLAEKSFKPYFDARLANYGIEEFSPSDNNPDRLYYVSAAPILISNGHQAGTLLIGQYISSHFSFKKLDKILPLLNIHITQRSKQRIIFENKYLSADLGVKSFTIPLQNRNKQVIGSVLVSTPISSEKKLYEHELLMTLFYLTVSIALLIWLGFWLNRSIIQPLQSITDASIQVAQGDFSTRVPETIGDEEMQQTLENFNHMTRQLEETSRLRHTFIASLTHDLRTPLLAEKRVLGLFLDFKDELPTNFAQLAEGLVQSNEHLISMVNTMLEAYQLEAGKIHLSYSRFPISATVQDCIGKVLPLAEMRQITVLNDTDDPPLEVTADQHLFKRVLINLLGNAVDNLEPGNSVRVQAFNRAGHIVIEVQDNGPGIPEESLPNIFERYTTGKMSRQKIASGLGLFICKIIMEAHGGTIAVDSKIDNGTIFILTFPKVSESSPKPHSQTVLSKEY